MSEVRGRRSQARAGTSQRGGGAAPKIEDGPADKADSRGKADTLEWGKRRTEIAAPLHFVSFLSETPSNSEIRTASPIGNLQRRTLPRSGAFGDVLRPLQRKLRPTVSQRPARSAGRCSGKPSAKEAGCWRNGAAFPTFPRRPSALAGSSGARRAGTGRARAGPAVVRTGQGISPE